MGALRVGILAIQGDVDAHRRALARLGVAAVPVRAEKDLDALAALILPGGESTTISKGLARVGLYEPIRAFAHAGRPILGTCAGAVLLAREVENHPVPSLGLVDIVAVRNAYGTQVDSFAAVADSETLPGGCAASSSARRSCDALGPRSRCWPASMAGRCSCARVACSRAPSTPSWARTRACTPCWSSSRARRRTSGPCSRAVRCPGFVGVASPAGLWYPSPPLAGPGPRSSVTAGAAANPSQRRPTAMTRADGPRP